MYDEVEEEERERKRETDEDGTNDTAFRVIVPFACPMEYKRKDDEGEL